MKAVEDVPEGACKRANVVLNMGVKVVCELRSVECLSENTDAKV